MLRIRPEQIKAMQRGMHAEFVRRTVRVLNQQAPAFLEGLTEPQAFDKVEICVSRARDWGLQTEAHIRAFIALQVQAGQDFDRQPRFANAQAALGQSGRAPGERLAAARKAVAATLADGVKPQGLSL